MAKKIVKKGDNTFKKNNNLLPHDEYVKKMLSKPKAAKQLLELHLPKDLRESLDLGKISVLSTEFIEEDLQKRVSDLLYSIPFKNSDSSAYIYLAIEHQSSNDQLLPFRLFEYMMLIIRKHITNHKHKNLEKFPLIYPLVLYNGKAKFNSPRNLFELFAHPEKAKEYITGDYKLIDLNAMSDEELQNHGIIALFEYVLKHSKAKDLVKVIEYCLNNREFNYIIKMDCGQNYEYLKLALQYLNRKIEESKKEEFNNIIINSLSQQEGEEIMKSIADSYIEEGWKKGMLAGMEKGIEKERREVAKNLLNKGIDIGIITETTGLSTQEIQGLKKR